MTNQFFHRHPLGDDVGAVTDYDARPSLKSDGDSVDNALEYAWHTYQNLHDDHLTPDGKRSMMVGDIIKVEHNGTTSFHRVEMVGFKEINPRW